VDSLNQPDNREDMENPEIEEFKKRKEKDLITWVNTYIFTQVDNHGSGDVNNK
jgi:hypothetical protein